MVMLARTVATHRHTAKIVLGAVADFVDKGQHGIVHASDDQIVGAHQFAITMQYAPAQSAVKRDRSQQA